MESRCWVAGQSKYQIAILCPHTNVPTILRRARTGFSFGRFFFSVGSGCGYASLVTRFTLLLLCFLSVGRCHFLWLMSIDSFKKSSILSQWICWLFRMHHPRLVIICCFDKIRGESHFLTSCSMRHRRKWRVSVFELGGGHSLVNGCVCWCYPLLFQVFINSFFIEWLSLFLFLSVVCLIFDPQSFCFPASQVFPWVSSTFHLPTLFHSWMNLPTDAGGFTFTH